MFGSIPSLDSLDDCLSDPTNPIGMRMRAAYYLRHIHSEATPTSQETVVSILEKGLLEPRHGSLLRHEFAYVMGQMKDQRVRDCLSYCKCGFVWYASASFALTFFNVFYIYAELPSAGEHTFD